MKFYLPSSQDLWLEFVKLAQGGSAWVYPDPTLWYPADPDSLKIWLVPGIAFTPEGSRIGFGQGHYDAWLGNQKGIFVGLAYELQIVSGFNPEPFDIPMDIVITESHSYVRPETSAELEVIRGGLL
jgi:5-formyltetrahydrofolate cyclo-ligase